MFAVPCSVKSCDHTIPVECWECDLITILPDDYNTCGDYPLSGFYPAVKIDGELLKKCKCKSIYISKCAEALQYIPYG